MARPNLDPVREERIREENIGVAYGPEEQAMGWYNYPEDTIHFPFQAKSMALKVTSPLQWGEVVEVGGLTSGDTYSSDMLVQTGGRVASWLSCSPN